MEHYVTLFDSLFLPQGLALHASMERHAGNYTLWVLCVDQEAHDVLKRLQLPNLQVIRLEEVETDELLRVKVGRTRGEYCWTLTPFTPKFVFDRAPLADRVTYVDADTWLFSNPQELFLGFESSGKAVQITEHAYAPEYDQTLTSGRFCVQFVTFLRERGEVVRSWWAARCIEWCYARLEDGKFGDQKYLDDWPDRFANDVHVLQKPNLTQAPWNLTRFSSTEVVLYHFHSLRLLNRRNVLLVDPAYVLPKRAREIVYTPYLADLRLALNSLDSVGFVARPQISTPAWILRLRHVLRRLRRWPPTAWKVLDIEML